jgi:hypothetical protein
MINANFAAQDSGNYWTPQPSDFVYRSVQEYTHRPKRPQSTGRAYGLENETATSFETGSIPEEIRKYFVMPADFSVETFLTEHRSLRQTLIEGEPHLKECFGSDRIFRLLVTADEAGSRTLYAVVIWPGEIRDAREALAKFDDWWLAAARPGMGYLTFTYELV